MNTEIETKIAIGLFRTVLKTRCPGDVIIKYQHRELVLDLLPGVRVTFFVDFDSLSFCVEDSGEKWRIKVYPNYEPGGLAENDACCLYFLS